MQVPFHAVVLATLVAVATFAQVIPLAFSVGCDNSTSYPFQRERGCFKPAFTREIDNGGDPFIIVRFSAFNLPRNDYVLLRSLETGATVKLSGAEYHGAFDAPSINGSRLRLELYTRAIPAGGSSSPSTCTGFHVVGYTSVLQSPPTHEAVCGGNVERTQEAACFNHSPIMTARSRAVARLVINKDGVLTGCTGFLLGNEGHFITNNHCIATQSHASKTRFEFMAQTMTCPTKIGDTVCDKQLACPGDVWRGTATFLYTNEKLDYTIVLLDRSVVARYSYLKLRLAGPIVGEPIYSVQHPQAWGKRITDKTAWGKATIQSTNSLEASYLLDTRPMASGSPVLSTTDHSVVALHHGSLTQTTCPNFGIKSDLIANDLESLGLVPDTAFS
ncbi:hypothetical protein H310_09639 [Aphanomyces invadans]|uniref:Serine protease n=1 Tax=Aphanomyces invadans TaxID=157072 RepID=A0A024TT09_9STRA|nr:hypothetical protein H310_09639 [Aphanomyces invadans]ETV97285.1 hypothetical protein H310_09639 [Aphanomyces invadans]RHY21779.1 hypothetical protein DYB32_009709 [Aphanomyces invadans]|eukprot:XP_008873993.1 hypothetical protein H310_09639 [Aphanomyces invadans]